MTTIVSPYIWIITFITRQRAVIAVMSQMIQIQKSLPTSMISWTACYVISRPIPHDLPLITIKFPENMQIQSLQSGTPYENAIASFKLAFSAITYIRHKRHDTSSSQCQQGVDDHVLRRWSIPKSEPHLFWEPTPAPSSNSQGTVRACRFQDRAESKGPQPQVLRRSMPKFRERLCSKLIWVLCSWKMGCFERYRPPDSGGNN